MAIHRVFRPASMALFATLCLWLLLAAQPVRAITLLRDADIEHGLSQLAAPILRAAGLSPTRVRVLVVDDSKLNAFVVDNQTIFVHAGLIQKVGGAAMLQAVLAHEAAHIANGHIARRMGNLKSARTVAGLGIALAAVAAAAGGGEAAGGIALGTSSSAFRSFLAHTRAEEAAADRSAARFMRAAGVDPQGLVDLHKAFQGQELLSISRQDPYTRSHPLTSDRIRAAEAFVAADGRAVAAKPQDDYWFSRIRGKLSAFRRNPKWTLRRVGEERYPDVRLMREAIAHHRNNKMQKALRSIDGALAKRPGDAFYLDLKAQILMENRKMSQAVSAYRTAAAKAPRDALILGGLGRALLAAKQPKAALGPLEKARDRDFRDARVLRDLGQAYAQTGQTGRAMLASAQRYALQGRMKDAGRQASRAKGLLPRGSAGWRQADDIVVAAEKLTKGKKK